MKYSSDSLDILSVIDKKELRNCFEFLQKVFFLLDVLVFVCALGDFPACFASVLRQIARYLPHHGSKTDSKTHPKSSHDKFKTVSKKEQEVP
jgi:hypothetical protein